MRAIKGRDTGPERAVAAWLTTARFKFVRNDHTLPGSPDFSLPRHKFAIFVHGCFWHAHNCLRGLRKPKTNATYWRNKLNNNKRRDRRNVTAIKRIGWRTAVIWECKLADARTRSRLLEKIRQA